MISITNIHNSPILQASFTSTTLHLPSQGLLPPELLVQFLSWPEELWATSAAHSSQPAWEQRATLNLTMYLDCIPFGHR